MAKNRGILEFIKQHKIFFIAIIITLLRFLLWDIQYITQLLLPKHDSIHGFTAFATSMHSMRISGDIAWWNPIDTLNGGFAQYFIAFLSPLAPTYGSIIFILCAEFVKLLSAFNIVIPEWYLYVIVNSLIFPFLSMFFLLKLSSLFFKKTSTLILIIFGYFFSGIGLWIDSWFYFQDEFSTFFMLYAMFNFIRSTDGKSLRILLIAILCFLAAANYWSITNMPFILIFLIVFIYTEKSNWVNLETKLKQIFNLLKANKFIIGVSLCCIVVWVFLLGNVFLGQHENYSRGIQYTMQNAMERSLNNQSGYFLDFFQPILATALERYSVVNPIHNARYIGIMLIPLILLAFIQKNRNQLLFGALATICFAIITVPGFLLPVWNIALDFNQHFFYFYIHFLQISILLFAASSLDNLLTDESQNYAKIRKVLFIICLGCIFAVIVFYIMRFFYSNILNLSLTRTILLSSFLLFFACLFINNFTNNKKYIYIFLFLLLFTSDITRYYYESSLLDITVAKPAGSIELLKKPFTSDNDNTFSQNIWQLSHPIMNSLLPNNTFMPNINRMKVDVFRKNNPKSIDSDSAAIQFYKTLKELEGTDGYLFSSDDKISSDTFAFLKYGYNEFEIKCKNEVDSWIVLNQAYDPNWKIIVNNIDKSSDIIKANFYKMALKLNSGENIIKMEYWPTPRILYPYACAILQISIILLIIPLKNLFAMFFHRKGFTKV